MFGVELDEHRNAENAPLTSPGAGDVAVRVIRSTEQ